MIKRYALKNDDFLHKMHDGTIPGYTLQDAGAHHSPLHYNLYAPYCIRTRPACHGHFSLSGGAAIHLGGRIPHCILVISSTSRLIQQPTTVSWMGLSHCIWCIECIDYSLPIGSLARLLILFFLCRRKSRSSSTSGSAVAPFQLQCSPHSETS